jgi:glycosyltransferase involved in cell wall biosynthesis
MNDSNVMSPIRVIHLVESLDIGGIERIVQMLANHDEVGVRAEVLCASRGGPIADEIRSLGTPVKILEISSYYPAGIVRIARAIRKTRPDVVHSHGHFAGVLARAAALWSGVPVVIHHLHTIDTTLRRRHRRLERLLARATTTVICCSRAVERHAHQDLHLPGPLTRTIPNGIDPLRALKPEDARARLGDPRRPVIGCIGALAPHKGQEVLLTALERLPTDLTAGTLVLIGDGPERALLESRVRRAGHGWSVRFLGLRPDARSLLPALDLVVVPSIDREGFSLSALEAMDASLPVVASRVGGLPEVVEDGVTGLLVRPSDPDALAAGIATILQRIEVGPRLGSAGRRRVDRSFRGEAMARRLMDIYREALHERRAA